jgi:hypothetical protein
MVPARLVCVCWLAGPVKLSTMLAFPCVARRWAVGGPSIRWLLAVALTCAGDAHADLGPEAGDVPPVLSVSNVQADRVTLSWAPPPNATPPELYLLEGGLSPGQILASIPIGGATSSVSVSLGAGTYYARLHAVGGGARGPASNEVTFAVGLAATPSAPRVAAIAIGTDVALQWQPSFEGGETDSVVVEVSGPISTALSLPARGDIAFGGVPPGTYSLSFRARNGRGPGVAAPPVTLAVPGATVRALDMPPSAASAQRLPVRYEDAAAARLAQLVQREQLGAVVQNATSEFDAMLKLKDWVAAQWAIGDPVPYPPWDALTVLDWIRAGVTGGFCGQYAQVLLQSLAAFGVPARYVEIGTTSNPYNHFVTEVWSNDFRKWVMLDPTYNHHFERNGVPLSALEVRDALLDGRLDEVQVVLGAVRRHPSPAEWPLRTAEFFYYVRFHLNANHVSRPNEPPFDRFNDMVEWLDGRATPWELSRGPSPYPHELLTAASTGDRGLVDWQPNRVWIAARRTGVMEYTLDLQHSMLQPRRYEVRVVDAAGMPGPWRPETGNVVVWTIGTADRVLQVRGVNITGLPGPISSIHVAAP